MFSRHGTLSKAICPAVESVIISSKEIIILPEILLQRGQEEKERDISSLN